MGKNFSFFTRGPDRVSVELATVLSKKGSLEFKPLFDLVHSSLRSMGWASGGEEMLRLRTHEKLQKFLSAGIVTKNGKEYTGVPAALVNFFKMAAELESKVQTAIRNRATLHSDSSGSPPTQGTEATGAIPVNSLPPQRKVSRSIPRMKRNTDL